MAVPMKPPPKLSYSTDGDSFSEDSPVGVTANRLVYLAGAELVAARVKDETLSANLRKDIKSAQQKLIKEFLLHPPRSVWLGTQSEVADLVSTLGVCAAEFPDERMRELVLDIATSILTTSAVDDRG